MTTERTIIIGGGLMGVTTLYELISRGEAVTLFDANDALAHGASFANGGMLTASMSDPWNGPGVGGQLLSSLFDPYAAMKLRLNALPGMVGWGLRFLKYSSPERHKRATQLCFELATRSVDLLRRQIEELQIDAEIAQAGSLKVFEASEAFRTAHDMAEALSPKGLRYEVLKSHQLTDKEPELGRAAEQFVGGLYFPDDGAGDAHKFVDQLADLAMAKGARIELGIKATRIRTLEGRVTGVETEHAFEPAERVIICSGHAAPRLASPLGVKLPIRPAKGYSVTVDARGWDAKPRMAVVDDAMHAGVSVIGDSLRLVGTAEFAGDDASIEEARVDNLVALFKRLYPHLSDQLDQSEKVSWAGLRPMSADGLPLIGPAGPTGLWINSGQGHLGWTMASGSAELLADQIFGKTPQIAAEPFLPSR